MRSRGLDGEEAHNNLREILGPVVDRTVRADGFDTCLSIDSAGGQAPWFRPQRLQ